MKYSTRINKFKHYISYSCAHTPLYYMLVGSVAPVVLETIKVLIPLATYFTSVWLVFFHARSIQVRRVGFRVNDGNSSIGVFFQLLILVPMQTMVFETVLVLVGFFTSNHGTFEWFMLGVFHHIQMTCWVVDIHSVVIVFSLSRPWSRLTKR